LVAMAANMSPTLGRQSSPLPHRISRRILDLGQPIRALPGRSSPREQPQRAVRPPLPRPVQSRYRLLSPPAPKIVPSWISPFEDKLELRISSPILNKQFLFNFVKVGSQEETSSTYLNRLWLHRRSRSCSRDCKGEISQPK